MHTVSMINFRTANRSTHGITLINNNNKRPVNLLQSDGTRPGVPWHSSKPLSWGVTIT